MRWPRPLAGVTGWSDLDPLGSSELRELYTAMFFATYLGSIWIRARSVSAGAVDRWAPGDASHAFATNRGTQRKQESEGPGALS